MELKRGEGKQRFQKVGILGQGVAALKMVGGGGGVRSGNPLQTMININFEM